MLVVEQKLDNFLRYVWISRKCLREDWQHIVHHGTMLIPSNTKRAMQILHTYILKKTLAYFLQTIVLLIRNMLPLILFFYTSTLSS